MTLTPFLHNVPVPAAAMADLPRDGPSAPVRQPVQDPERGVSWMHSRHG
ncbi:hypothetical protein QF026_008475 [Streptomyces aurantiacus]|nr:hypothetical protein [Streptomyces aurantiacus]MDQ0780009.1 hypothetical protein [Streptomyces aurantiacus]